MTNFHIRYGAEVADALRDGRPVVALESTIVSHGLPRPENLRVARQIEATVRDAGAVPATIGMVGGELVVGLDDAQLTRLATVDGVAKLSVRDLAVAA
ncbi:pseudouridine-5'-phosphate glycosidase, partial [Micromonospora azadirachtae]